MAHKARSKRRLTSRFMMGAIMFLLIFASYILVSLHKTAHDASSDRFEQISQGYTTIYKQVLRSYIQHLRTIRSLFYSTDNVLNEEFSLFARQVIEIYPEIQAIKWVPKITAQERELFEVRMQNSGYPDFHITEYDENFKITRAEQRDIYFPAYYIEPLQSNLSLHGYNLASHKMVFEKLKEARDSGQSVASTQIRFAQTNDPTDSLILIILPVYQSRDTPERLEDKLRELNGFLLGNFLVGKSFNATVEDLDLSHISVKILDVTDTQHPINLFTINPLKTDDEAGIFNKQKLITSSQNFDISGRSWRLEFQTLAIDEHNRRQVLTNTTVAVTLLLILIVLGFGLSKKPA